MVNDGLILCAGNRRIEIPLLDFIAGWAVLCNDFEEPSKFDYDHGTAWRTRALPLSAWPLGRDRLAILESVEMICRILGDDHGKHVDWLLHDDADFLRRNAAVLRAHGADAAVLQDATTRQWDAADKELRNTVLERIHSRFFPVMLAHGQAMD